MARLHESRPTLIVGLCALVTILEGLDQQSAGVAAPRLAPALHLAPAALGWFFSMSTFGMFLGAAIGGRLSDRFGRKPVLLVAVAIFGVSSAACALAGSLRPLMIARFVTGVGLGGALPNVLAIVVEAGIRLRSFSIGVLNAGLPIGAAGASTMIMMAAPPDWRFIFWAGGILPLALLPFLAAWLPGTRPDRMQRTVTRNAGQFHGIVFALFGEHRTRQTVLICSAFMCSALFPFLMLYWLPILLIGRGLSQSAAFAVQTVFNLSGAVGSLITGALMDRLPHPAVVIGIFSLLLLALWTLASVPGEPGVSLLAGGFTGVAVAGAQASLYALAPTLYPAVVRGTGLGAAVSAGRLGAAAGPLLAAAMIGRGGSAQHVLLNLLPIALVAGMAAFGAATRVQLRK